MAKIIGIMGESGAGKTTSMRNLDSKTTLYIDCDKKGLSWKGWKDQYNLENKNYLKTDSQGAVLSMLNKINTTLTHINTVVIDTLNGIMVADEMRRAKEKNYDKWLDLAVSVWEIIDKSLSLRDDLTIIFIAHAQVEKDDSGGIFARMKTSGKKLDKIVLESKMPTVLLAKARDGEYIFETRAKNSTTKTPMGAFEQDEIPNDIMLVLEALKDY